MVTRFYTSEETMENSYETYWLEKGTVLTGKYRIDDVISEGGFGIVYLGFDMVLKMAVAIKEYFPRRFAIREQNSADIHVYKGKAGENFKEGLQKFLNEARILAKFNTLESIVTVRDFFYENNTAYIVNEHVVGETVKEHIRECGRMKPEKVLEIMKPILVSLSAIHSEGLLHRDISPDNIILKENRAVLIDFGAARLFQEQEDKSMTVFFKRGYSAQEQYVKNGKQTARTDVYAVCATMYYMLTGIHPEESVQRGIKDTVVPLNKMKDIELSLWAKNAIMKGMSVSVAERYSSVENLCKELYKERRRWSFIPAVSGIALAFLMLTVGIYVKGELAKGIDRIFKEDKAVQREMTEKVSLTEQEKESIEEAEKITSTPEPAPTVVTYQIPKVTALKQSEAVTKLRKKSPPNMEIIIKKEYSETVKAGRVIRQNKKDGTSYEAGEIKKIKIWVSKGKKPVASSEPVTAASSPAPQSTSQQNTQEKKKEKKGDFAGALPW